MGFRQGGIISKPKQPEFSLLFATHHLGMIKLHVKFHEYIPYGLGVMAQTQFFTLHTQTGVKSYDLT